MYKQFIVSIGRESGSGGLIIGRELSTKLGVHLFGKKYNSNIIVGMVIILSNFIYEIFLPILNTTDIVDAVYGLVGTIISLIYLYIISKYGFKTNK